MKRIRNLGLVTLAALALVAVFGVASASAGFAGYDEYTGESVSSTTQGETIGFTTIELAGLPYSAFSCDGTFETKAKLPALATSPEGISGPITGVVPQPHNCNAGLSMNGCDLTFHTYNGESKGEFPGTFDIGGCSSGIKLSTKLLAECKATIIPQTGLPASYRNIAGSKGTPGWVEIEMQAKSGVQIIGEGGNYAACPEGPSTAAWTGTWKVRAKGPSGEFAKLAALSGERSLYRNAGEFGAVNYPVQVGGDQSSKNELWLGFSKIGCKTAHLSTELTGATATLTPVYATYVGCIALIGNGSREATVDMKSCYYGIGSVLSVGCAKEGDAIVAKLYESGSVKCTYTISPQSSATGLTFANTNEGMTVGFNESTIQYNSEGGILNCGVLNGVHTGRYVGSSALRGFF